MILLYITIGAWFWWLLLRLYFQEPNVWIGGLENPYLLRWYILPRNPIFNIYLHKFLRDDDDRALHDHPWASVSLVFSGKYMEWQPEFPDLWPHRRGLELCTRRRGNIVLRRATHAHRIVLFKYTASNGHGEFKEYPIPAWTLFVTGPKVREWGFHCPQGWRHWRLFCDEKDSSKIGRGCE